MSRNDAIAYLILLAEMLRQAPRSGVMTNYPEGMRVVHLSDGLAREIADKLTECVAACRI